MRKAWITVFSRSKAALRETSQTTHVAGHAWV